MTQDLSRRGFMLSSAGAAIASGPAVLPSLGANDKINVAFIGAGGRGFYAMERLYRGSEGLTEVTTVCDA
jgi:hypothetical protein